MKLEYNESSTQGKFIMHVNNEMLNGKGILETPNTTNTFVLNKGDEQKVNIDEIPYTFLPKSILPLVGNQRFLFENPENLVAWQFNREFYCILDHDHEVGCVGFLFYGVKQPIFIKMDDKEIETFSLLEKNIKEELSVSDNYQGEMLRSLLKRLIITATRMGKKQSEAYQLFSDEKMDMIRKFSLLVEGNFRKEHEVKFYAEAMNKSPKTLSNFFASSQQPSPLKIIHNRIILEAKRFLYYTDKSAKEIAYDLGFENPEHFSRFFRKNTKKSITDFRNEQLTRLKNENIF